MNIFPPFRPLGIFYLLFKELPILAYFDKIVHNNRLYKA